MQLTKRTNIRPILISTTILAGTPTFAYQDLSFKSEINLITVSPATNNHNPTTMQYDTKRYFFQDVLKKWENNTRFMSSPSQIVEEENFKKIVSMKENAVPYIISELEKKASTLVWALNFIYQRSISSQNITIERACNLWIRELKKVS